MKKVICYISGVAKGNPGAAAVGVYITDEMGVMMSEVAETIGNGSTDFAEYQAVLVGLQSLVSLLGDATTTTAIELRLTNELVKKQLNAESQIQEPGFVPLFIGIHNICVVSFPHLTFALISAEQNVSANKLVNEALHLA